MIITKKCCKKVRLMKYFISHSSKDKSSVDLFVKALKECEGDLEKNIFCSSIPENGSDYKEELITNINDNISKAENIVLIITENYLRSAFCFYEMSLARYLKKSDKKIILIVENETVALRIDSIFPSNTFLHIGANLDSASETLVKTLECSVGAASLFVEFFSALRNIPSPVGTPYIGMTREKYDLIYDFVETNGVEKIGFDYPATPDVVKNKTADAEEIYFVSTTGSGFLKTYKEVLSNLVANGCKLSLVISDKNSDFSLDVADIEAINSVGYDQLKRNNEERILGEFGATFQYLNEIYAASHKSQKRGTISCASCYSLIRQTAFIAKKRNGTYWGWITCTMPPIRSADKTPSIVFEGNDTNILVNDVWVYVTTLFALSDNRGGVFEINGIDLPEKLDSNKADKDFNASVENAKKYWIDKYNLAQKYMFDREKMVDGVLIEVAAQHPLKNRCLPNKEFQARLNKAIELYNKHIASGDDVMIYVPGSRHMFENIADDISLSEAGVNYLLNQGIPAEHLLGETENNRYKGQHGVYNSADECYVASQIFKNGQFEKLICVCSPNQIMRKTMLYIEFGCIPICYGVTTEKMFHKNIVEEIFNSLNHVLYVDHSWQDENSSWFKYFRDTRRPKAE